MSKEPTTKTQSAQDSPPKEQSDVPEKIDELSKAVRSLVDRQKELEIPVNRLCAKLQKMAEDQASNRFCVIGIHTLLLVVLAGSVIAWPVGLGQATVLCSVVICGSLLGVMYFVTGRPDEDD